MARPDPKANGRTLESFLRRNGISLRAAAAVFGVSHVTVHSWTTGAGAPELDEMRRAIERWTAGEVSAEGWDTKDERARRVAMACVEPFRAAE